MNENLVDIHVPKRMTPAPDGSHLDAGLAKWGRAELALALAEQDVSVVFSRGSNAYDHERHIVSVLTPSIQREGNQFAVTVTPAIVALESIRAIRNVAAVIGHDVPELNNPRVRALTRDKGETNTILQTLGIAKNFGLWNTSKPLADVLDELTADGLVIKPRSGMRGQDVHLGSRKDLQLLAAKGIFDANKDWIIEERLAMDMPMPVTGYDNDQQALIDSANANSVAKELRAYTFGYHAGELAVSYVLRVAKAGMNHLRDDSWVFVDQETIPDELRSLTQTVADQFAATAKVSELHLGIDWVRTRGKDGMPQWVPMEVNAGEPQLVYSDEHEPTAKQHRTMLATQLRRVAEAGTTEYSGKDATND